MAILIVPYKLNAIVQVCINSQHLKISYEKAGVLYAYKFCSEYPHGVEEDAM